MKLLHRDSNSVSLSNIVQQSSSSCYNIVFYVVIGICEISDWIIIIYLYMFYTTLGKAFCALHQNLTQLSSSCLLIYFVQKGEDNYNALYFINWFQFFFEYLLVRLKEIFFIIVYCKALLYHSYQCISYLLQNARIFSCSKRCPGFVVDEGGIAIHWKQVTGELSI